MAKNIESIFDRDEFGDLAEAMQQRRNRTRRFWSYYKLDAYDTMISSTSKMSELYQYMNERLKTATLPLFQPLPRAVALDVALIPGRWRLAEASAPFQPFADAIFRASRWPIEGDKFTRFMAATGEAGLYLVDAGEGRGVKLQALRPDRYITRRRSRWDNTPGLAIILDEDIGADGKPVEYAVVISDEEIQTYTAGQPDEGDGRDWVGRWRNRFGFVPLFVAINDLGDGLGEPTFDDAIQSLDQVNTLATYLATIIKRHAEPQWAAFGADAGDLEKSGDSVWFFPEGSDVKAILAAVDFPGVLAFVDKLLSEVKSGLPELQVEALIGLNRLAMETIEFQFMETTAKIRKLRKPIDLAIGEALTMAAATMAGDPLLPLPLEPIDLDETRPVITLDALTRAQLEQAQNNNQLTRLALERERQLDAARVGAEV